MIPVADLFGYTASAYRAVLAVYVRDEVTFMPCPFEPNVNINFETPEPDFPEVVIMPTLDVCITDTTPRVVAFIRRARYPEGVRIALAWDILALAFRRSDDLTLDADIIHIEEEDAASEQLE
ncbi:hypothetical protein SVAN01_10944 [Stagonosporopsis vannaccii]|nr:hypothetical protein SVAN01_10944 [Stagonosporopsis vannaccii]